MSCWWRADELGRDHGDASAEGRAALMTDGCIPIPVRTTHQNLAALWPRAFQLPHETTGTGRPTAARGGGAILGARREISLPPTVKGEDERAPEHFAGRASGR
jgi:hypothetical protein